MKKMKIIILMVIGCLISIGIVAAELGQAKMNFTAIDDSKISSENPNQNYGNLQLRVGVYDMDIYRTYIKFNISEIPASSNLLNAKISLTKFGGTGTSDVEAYRVLSNSWNENMITWSNSPNIFSDALSTTLMDSSFTVKNIGVTNGVSDSLANGIFSVMLRNKNESFSTNYHLFHNKEQSVNGPILEVEFLSNKPEIVQVGYPLNSSEGNQINLSFAADDLDNNIQSYRIYFDGMLLSESSSATFTLNYESSGMKELKIIVIDKTGLYDEEIRQIMILDTPNLKINEFMPLPVGQNEWVELYNPTNEEKDVTGCEIRDGFGNSAEISGKVNSSSFGVIQNLGQVVYGQNMFNDAGDMVRLFCNNILLDEATYGNWDDGNLDDNILVPGIGKSLGRVNDGLDTDVDENDFVQFDEPTQGRTNYQVVCGKGDQDCNGCLTLLEVLNYITLYKSQSSSISLLDVLNVISDYKTGGNC